MCDVAAWPPRPRVRAACRTQDRRSSQYATWLGLAALGSVVLLGTSAHLTQNIASVPFLWVLPLGLYLASFVIVFDGRGGRGGYDRRWGLPAMLVATVLMAAGLAASQGALHVLIAVPLYGAGLLAVCVFCHGELALRKPAQQHLTHFYLSLAAGGALGGLAVALGGPQLLRRVTSSCRRRCC